MTPPEELMPTPTPWATHSRFHDHIVPADHVDRKLGGSIHEIENRDEYAQVICRMHKDRHGRGSPEANATLIVEAVNTRAPSIGDADKQAGQTHLHLKSGHLVREIGRGFAQVSAHPIEEMTAVSIYEHGGRLWVRNAVEFDDGRFEKLPAPFVALSDPAPPADKQADGPVEPSFYYQPMSMVFSRSKINEAYLPLYTAAALAASEAQADGLAALHYRNSAEILRTDLEASEARLATAERERDEALRGEPDAKKALDALALKWAVKAWMRSVDFPIQACEDFKGDVLATYVSLARPYLNRAEAAEAKVLALTTAAAPLIDWLTKLEVEFSKTDDNVIAGGIRGISITFGDLRKLRAALEQASKAGGGA